jgi:hypothetical protein
LKGRGPAALAALLVVVWVTTSSALAQQEVSMTPGADGNVLLVGNGWRPGQRLVLTVGRDVYPAFVDSAGGFEVATGTAPLAGQVVLVRPLAASATPAMARLDLETEPGPNPFAVLFAESLLAGGGLLVGVGGGLGLIAGARRVFQRGG